MRISVDGGDPGYEQYCRIINNGDHIKVHLGGRSLPMENVVMADSDKGLLTLITDRMCGSELCRKYIAGEVEIIITSYDKVGKAI